MNEEIQRYFVRNYGDINYLKYFIIPIIKEARKNWPFISVDITQWNQHEFQLCFFSPYNFYLTGRRDFSSDNFFWFPVNLSLTYFYVPNFKAVWKKTIYTFCLKMPHASLHLLLFSWKRRQVGKRNLKNENGKKTRLHSYGDMSVRGKVGFGF